MSDFHAPEHGEGPSHHIIQLFDSTDSRTDALAAFVREGLAQGDSLLVVMRLEQWNLAAAKLRREELRLSTAILSGQLTVRDAQATLDQFMRNGVPDEILFDRIVGGLVRQLASSGNRLRVYGEMVDLLAVDGRLRAAHELEELWNGLLERESFTLFCGYGSLNFADSRTANALQLICRSHSQVRSHPEDAFGAYLVESHGSTFPH